MLREFKPKRHEPGRIEPHELAALFEKGEFRKPLSHCRKMGYSLDEFSDQNGQEDDWAKARRTTGIDTQAQD